jgi:amino acid adenylation domain-containing protein
MQGHFETILEAIVLDPSLRVSEIELLDEGERQTLLVSYNETGRELTAGMCVHGLFEAQVAASPDRVALVAEDVSLTYGELDFRANQLARHLVELGVTEETLVGVNLARTSDLLVAVLAILKAGGAYLPLDAAFPAERLAYMLEDAGAPLVVTTSELLDSLPSFEGHAVCQDRDGATIAELSGAPLEATVAPENLAYTIYTSGSTGKPKGVEVTHGNAVNFLLSMAERPGLSSDDVLLAVTTLSFDISVLELFGPVSVGGRVVIASGDEAASGEALVERLGACGATVLQATPATWRMLYDAGWQGDQKLRVLVGGEALSSDLAQELVTSCGEVWNMYGPTETTVWSSCWRVPTQVDQIRVGTPIGNTQLYVLDGRMKPTPLGVPGELYIGGAGVTRGYRDRPELTTERFVPDPFSSVEGDRLYRTGDLARFRDDGTVEYLGRLDNQVKIRGFRIELGEIEAVLAEHEAVKQAVATVAAAGTADARLVAYVVLERGEALTVSEVRRFLRARIPDYMVPGLVVELDDFPLTPNGKIDRRALPDPLASSARSESEFSPPATQSEILIAEVWADLLSLDRVSRHDNFYQLGGHSLLSLRAVAAMSNSPHNSTPLLLRRFDDSMRRPGRRPGGEI